MNRRGRGDKSPVLIAGRAPCRVSLRPPGAELALHSVYPAQVLQGIDHHAGADA